MKITLDLTEDEAKLVKASLVVLSKETRIAKNAMLKAAAQMDEQIYPSKETPATGSTFVGRRYR